MSMYCQMLMPNIAKSIQKIVKIIYNVFFRTEDHLFPSNSLLSRLGFAGGVVNLKNTATLRHYIHLSIVVCSNVYIGIKF